MGFLDQFAVWQQVAGAIVIFGILSATLYALLKRWSHVEQVAAADAPPSDASAGTSPDAYAPMFRRIAPPTQPVAITPETPRPGLSATTSTPSRTPTKPVAFTEPASVENVTRCRHPSPFT